jgi:hypothetical protein
MFQRILGEGKVTREASRELLWMGCSIITRLVCDRFRIAIREGAASWDCVLIHAFVLSLSSAAGARGGDVGLSAVWGNTLDKEKEIHALRLKFVQLFYTQDISGQASFSMKITMRTAKGRKYKQSFYLFFILSLIRISQARKDEGPDRH